MFLQSDRRTSAERGVMMSVQRIAVYCASSNKTDPEFQQSARRLGECLAREKITIVYGGGRVGSMGQLADGALAEGGYVVGVIPNFMAEIEWGHTGVNELHVVDDMHGRKRMMLERSDAVVALPGPAAGGRRRPEAADWRTPRGSRPRVPAPRGPPGRGPRAAAWRP